MGGEEVGALGEVIGGAGAARAVEAEASGERTAGGGATGEGENCLNCGCALEGAYCHCCGQKAHLHKTIGGLLHDLMHGVLHLDGKLWRTLPHLVWKPGKLTRDYIDGHRARYISPIAFYLFTVVTMFALVVSLSDMAGDDVLLDAQSDIVTVEEADARLTELEADLEELRADDFPGVEGAIVGVEAEIRSVEQRRAVLSGEGREPGIRVTTDEGNDVPGFLEGIEEAFEKASGNPSLFLYKVQTTAYKLSWLLIPLSLPFMWLLFPFSRKFGLYDHAVFVTYSISFMMLGVILVGLVNKVTDTGVVAGLFVLYAPFHLYRQLKGTYGLSRTSAVIRTALLSVITWVVLTIFAVLMFALGAVG